MFEKLQSRISKKSVWALGIISVILTTFIFAGQAVAELKTLKIAIPGDYTGYTADQARHFFNGAKMAADEVNANGGVEGYRLKLVKFDSKDLKPDQALSVVNKILDDDEILATITSNISHNVFEAEHFGKAHMPYTISSSPEEFKKVAQRVLKENPENFETVWSFAPSITGYQTDFPPVLEQWVKQGLLKFSNGRKVAMITSDIPYSLTIYKGLIKTFKSMGWTITMEEKVPSGEIHDWTVIFGKIRKNPPDIIINTDWLTSDATTFTDEFHKSRINSLLFYQYAPVVPEFVELTGKKGEGVLSQIIGNPLPTERATMIRELYQKKYNTKEQPGFYSYIAYEQMMLYVDAVKITKNPEDRRATGKAMGQVKKEIHAGMLEFDEKTHMSLSGDQDHFPTGVIQIQNGKATLIWPARWAQAEFKKPKWLK